MKNSFMQNNSRSNVRLRRSRSPKFFLLVLVGLGTYFLFVFTTISTFPFQNLNQSQLSDTLKSTFTLDLENIGNGSHVGNALKGLFGSESPEDEGVLDEKRVLTAYIEEVDLEGWWKSKPLAIRNTTSQSLKVETFPNLNSCRNLPGQWPTDDPPTERDAFLPWIHDVFPTADGKYIQFIAQNRRRCQTGAAMAHVKKRMQPNVALFQQVPIKRIATTGSKDATRYRLSSYEDADQDGIATRFICRFKPSMEETLSESNVDYDYHTLRKGYQATFTEEGFDNHMIWTSQLLFRCPVPEGLRDVVRLGSSVKNDYATLFVDLIPIRTPPNYGGPSSFLNPKYGKKQSFNPDDEWGKGHILPEIKDSGRFENIPICKPSLMTYPDEYTEDQFQNLNSDDIAKIDRDAAALADTKKHELVACTWASTSFHTRGSRTVVNDGEQRLLEWAEFNKMVGVDHIYIFDNSGQFSDEVNLKPITDLFPGYITRVDWPSKVCNNNPNHHDNKGERSSQYAAESACRLRFGEHSKWLMSVDTDEYLVPLGKYTELKGLLNDLKKDDIRILQFKSKRAKPRLSELNNTMIKDEKSCYRGCIDTTIPKGKTFLGVYNCDIEKPPRKKTMPAEKQIYQPDYVKLHFVHYSTITTDSQLSQKEFSALYNGANMRHRYNEKRVRFADEITEGTMLHTKAFVTKETNNWSNNCNQKVPGQCKLGIAFPTNKETGEGEGPVKVKVGNFKLTANCYPHTEIDDIWVPKLTKAVEERRSEIADGKISITK